MKYRDFYRTIKKPYFSVADIKLQSLPVNNLQLWQWAKKNEIIRLKKGWYVFADRQADVSLFEIAGVLYQPSYVSMESAMYYYNFIPDVVMATTSITTKVTRNFTNQYGYFVYRNIRPELFFGYDVKKGLFGQALMATPEKALLDYLYLNLGQINNIDDIEELRLNDEMLREKIDPNILNQYLVFFQSKKLARLIQLIIKTCSLSNN